MKKITLIRPPFIFPKAQKRGNFGTPPLGIAYLSATLKQRGYEVQCIDAYGEKIEDEVDIGNSLKILGLNKLEICNRILPGTELIGISCMFSNEWIYTREVINEISLRFPDSIIVLGGEHPTADPEQCFFDVPSLKYIVAGEGEATICEFIEAIDDQKNIETVNGLILKLKGQIHRNPPRTRIQNINSIPWPDWSSIPIDNYLEKKVSYGLQGKRSMPILASRGCPYSCTFCSNSLMWGNQWKVRFVDDVLGEIETYYRKYQIEHFDFMDLTAIIREDWIVDFCEKLVSKKFKMTWALPTGTRSEALNAKTLEVLKKSGCVKINYAPESGSADSLRRIKKKIDLKRMQESMRIAVKFGIICRANLIIGLPGDGFKDLMRTYLFTIKLAFIGLNDIACFGFSPYPGSELHNELVAKGRVSKKEGPFTMQIAQSITNAPSSTISWTDRFSTIEVRFHIWFMMVIFYMLQFIFRPYRVVTTLNRIFSGNSLTTFEIVFSNYLKSLKSEMKSRHLNSN